MTKKSLSLILALLIILSAFAASPLTAFAEDTAAETDTRDDIIDMKTGDLSPDSDIAAVGSDMVDPDYPGYEYVLLDDGTAKITSYQTLFMPEEIRVPETLGGHQVTETGTLIFRFYKEIKKIILPNGLKTIGSYTSSGCTNLSEVVIPNTVTKIDEGAFYGSPKLTAVNIPASVTEIGPLAFGYYWDYDSENDAKISNLKIRGKTGTAAEKYAKENGFAFEDTSGSSGSLGSFKWTIDSDGTLTIIGKGAMPDVAGSWGDKVKKAVIQNGITSVGSMAFYGCTEMTEVVIPDTVTAVGEGAFYNCNSLADFKLPNSIKTISRSSFAYCHGLKSVTLPSSVTKIEDYAFYSCYNLTDVTLPDSLTDIGELAFCGCSKLNKINIPKSVKNIGDTAFGACGSLSQVNITDIAAWLKISFDSEAANPLRYNNADLCLNGKLLTDLVIPDGITRINKFAFNGCQSLKSVTMPEGVTDIEKQAFYDCPSLIEVNFSDTVKTIGNNAFYNCPKLLSLELPDSVTSIGTNAFYGCNSLKNVKLPKNLTELEYGVFQKCEYLTEIVIPDSVKSICDYAFYECYRLGSVTIPDTVETIGLHAFFDTSWYNRLYNSSPDGVIYINNIAIRYKGSVPEKLVIKDGTKGISPRAFWVSDNITEVSLPDSLIYIGYEAFHSCDGLTKITIPDSVTNIGESAFGLCDNLEKVNVSTNSNLKKIGWGAFLNTPWLDNQPDGLLYIGRVAYEMIGDCPAEVVLKEGTMSISDSAFYGIEELESIVIPDSVTSIGNIALFGCSNLKSITIPASVTEIGHGALGFDGSYYMGNWHAIDGFTIKGYRGTAAEKYAAENGLTFVPLKSSATISGKIVSYLKNTDSVSVLLMKNGSVVKNAILKGNSVNYSFTDVDAGKYTLHISKKDHTPRDYTITVSNSNITQDVEICPIGDVTGDGKTNVQDCTSILRYVRKLDTELSDYQLKCGDVTGDGKVNVQDVTRILRHVRKIETLY